MEPFALERYFAKHEFSTEYLLSSSDCDGWAQSELLGLADPEARALWEDLRLGYSESLGHPLLRREIAALYKGVDPAQVLTAVPEEAILIAMNSLLERGDHVVCTFPGYRSLYSIAESLGCRVEKWRPEPEDGWRFDVDALIGLLRPDTKLIIVNFPHNPTGQTLSPADYRRVVEAARERGIWLFSDEMYRLLELDAGARLPSACELYDKAITLFGMSKSFGLAGTRVGWLVAKDKALFERMAAYKDYTTICGAAPSELLALIGLRAKETILARHMSRIRRNLALLDEFLG
ncbi:MAG: aminotransferase class I/II-fold pyridoxal phosphate-dependent enzyme [Elusimicrobia bacterium]|nr:aminotransferase class I/II-fold pyridoxal phosphate-dependent enzyme [Elusimicrobiota bacterium]